MNEEMTNEIVETEEEAIEERVPKGAIIAGVAGAVIAVGAGIKWLIGKLRDTNPDYVYPEDSDFGEEILGVEDTVEIEIEEE